MARILRAQHDRFPLARPFRISRGVKTEADVVTVTLEQDGVAGRGEGVPYPRYGESIETTLAEIESLRGEIEAGIDRRMLQSLIGPGAARNAIDCALWDLEARRAGTTVARLIGAPEPGAIASALTVGIDTPKAMGAAARAIAGAPVVKVKVDAFDPASALRAVHAECPGAALIVDPKAMMPLLAQMKVALLEQPVPAGKDEWLERYVPAVPICADEAVHVTEDLEVVARRYQAVNIKLDKSGGLTAALELAEATRAAGLKLMTGCMISSSLSIAASLHVARMSDFADLDGPIWLAEDRPGGVTDQGGMLLPPASGFWGGA
jgi:L-alanine-DL-glutamate epimerase-like enolase superfamily enzyme